MIKNKLRMLREANRKSLEQVARAVGVKRAHISNIENNKRYPGIEIMFKLANYFKIKVDELFQYESEKEINKD